MFSIIGHEKILDKLLAHLNKDPEGVYLFYGPPSMGKRTIAFEFSKYLLCETKKSNCTCSSCLSFPDKNYDFLCIGRDDKIKVADIDNILNFSDSKSLSDYKICVMDNVDNITGEASDRLLKLLEEPSKGFIFFLVTSNISSIKETILSRCFKYEFSLLSKEELTNVLWKKMGFELSQAKALGWIAHDLSIDIFSKADKYLLYRDKAFDLINNIKKKSLIDILIDIDNIPKEDLSVFLDMFNIIWFDLLYLKNNIEVVNNDLEDKLTRLSESFDNRVLIALTSSFSQLKRYLYLNINILSHLKNIIIKNHPLIMVEA